MFYIALGVAVLLIQGLVGLVATKETSPQTLGLGLEPNLRPKIASEEKHSGRDLGLLGGLLFLPVLFLLAIVSIPVAFVAAYFQRRRDRAFFLQMSARRRALPWPEFRDAVEESRGTLIREWYSLKGPVHWWWTTEDIYGASPEPIAQSVTGSCFDEYNRPLAEWIRQRYTDQNSGQAMLVADDAAAEDEAYKLWSALQSDAASMKWIEVAPPESLWATRPITAG